MTKLDKVEILAQELECSYETAFDIIYGTDFICDEDETDY